MLRVILRGVLVVCACAAITVSVLAQSSNVRDLQADEYDVALYGSLKNSAAGFAVAVGDVNGDGMNDLILGAPFTTVTLEGGKKGNQAGVTYIYFGRGKYEKTIDLSAGADVMIEGAVGTDWVGFAVATGDVNGDGIADVVMGAPQADSLLAGKQNDSGITYVVFGRKSFGEKRILLGKKMADVEFHSTKNGEYSGSALAIGDFNGDGMEDVMIGSPFTDKPLNDAGVVYVACGSKTLAGVKDLSKDACTSVRGQNAGDRVGLGVAAGDVNGDGISDLVLGGLETDSGTISNTGDVTVIFGQKNLPPQFDLKESAGFRFWGSNSGEYVGESLATADVNGDGVADLIIGVPYADLKGGEAAGEDEDKKEGKKEADAGKVAVFYGGKDLGGEKKLADGADVMIYGAQGGTNYGDHAGGTLGVGDVNGDGIADLLIGASLADVRGRTRKDPEQMKDVGAVFVCYGGKALPKTISLGEKSDAVILGAFKNDMFAGVALTKPRKGQTLFSPSAYRKAWMTRRYDRFFSKGLAAGDINGDGVADMILGAPAGDGPRAQGQKIDDAGVVYVVFGKK